MIRQVEAPRWNETHPFPLSAICCCNDLREDGEEKGAHRDGSPEPVSSAAALCRDQPLPFRHCVFWVKEEKWVSLSEM